MNGMVGGPRRRLGSTGRSVSTLGFGTVELGLDYGLPKDGALPRAPSEEEGVALLLAAFAEGVDVIDTAPGYGRAEAVVGAALRRWTGPRPFVATKVPCPDAAALAAAAAAPDGLARTLRASLEASLGRLGLRRVDLVQVHNATEDALRAPALAAAMEGLAAAGLTCHLGASTYGPAAARAAIAAPWCETIQLAYNLLDQHPASALIDEAKAAGMGVLVRSALLKGVLASAGDALPAALRPLLGALARAASGAAALHQPLAETALQFVLSDERVDTVLVGIDRPAFLETDLRVWRARPLAPPTLAALRAVHDGSALTDPRTWGF